MTIYDFLISHPEFSPVHEGDFSIKIDSVFCCDLLSFVMGRAPVNCAWVTVMGNVNSMAVAVLTDMAVIVLAENSEPDENALVKAKMQNINIIRTKLPIFEAATIINESIKK